MKYDDKRLKENQGVSDDLIYIRQLDRMLQEFMFDRSGRYAEFFSTEVSPGLQTDVEVIQEAQRRIHYIRLAVAFKEHEPDADDVLELRDVAAQEVRLDAATE